MLEQIIQSLINVCTGDYKMVLVVRKDLQMGTGKIASQCSHASVHAYKNGIIFHSAITNLWEDQGSKKVVLKANSEKEIKDLCTKAAAMNVPFVTIRDAGRTQIAPNSLTVMALGPFYTSEIDKITKHLKLL